MFTFVITGAVMAPTSLDNRPVSDKELHDIGSSLPSSWKRLGRCLRIPEKGLETIDMREHDTGRKGILMLNMWKETWGKYATGSVLKVALEEIGRPDLSIKGKVEVIIEYLVVVSLKQTVLDTCIN